MAGTNLGLFFTLVASVIADSRIAIVISDYRAASGTSDSLKHVISLNKFSIVLFSKKYFESGLKSKKTQQMQGRNFELDLS